MNDQQRELLRELVEFLSVFGSEAEYKDMSFNMDHWSCGSSACAIGHAYYFLPSWREAGLEMTENQVFPSPVFRGQRDYDAVASFLGLSRFEAQALFDPNFYNNDDEVDPWTVAHRINAFLEGRIV